MSLKDQLIRVTNFVGLKRGRVCLVREADVGSGTWAEREVYLKPGPVVYLKCICDKRPAFARAIPVAIIRMKDVESSSFLHNYKK